MKSAEVFFFRMFLNPVWCLQGSLQQTSTKVNSMLPEQKILQITPDCFEAYLP